MSIEREIKDYIDKELLGDGAGGVELDEALIASGRLDSLRLMQLLDHIHRNWKVDLMAVAGPDDFTSVETLAQAVRRHVG
jgi:acyl carrier protein